MQGQAPSGRAFQAALHPVGLGPNARVSEGNSGFFGGNSEDAMSYSREEELEGLVKELLHLVEETGMPRYELHRRASEARAEAERLMVVGPRRTRKEG